MSELTEKEKQDQAAALEVVNKAAEAKAQEVVNKAFEGKEFISKEDAQKVADEAAQKAVSAAKTELDKRIDATSALAKKASQISRVETEGKTAEQIIKSALGEAIVDGEAKLKAYRSGDKLELTAKALAPSNFGVGNYADLVTERRPGLYIDPYAPVWLRNIFPNATTSGETIKYLKRAASTGKAALWARGTGEGGATVDKPDVTPNFVSATADVVWIAGMTDVPREMLQDVSFLSSYIPNNLIYSADGIFAAENEYIMDYIAANAVDFSRDADYPIALEKVIAAAFGQLGSLYLQPTHILINNWDYLTYLAFNKADGSGEYDQPGLSVEFINGQMTINKLIAVPVPAVEAGTAYVIAANESQFVTRMSPEVQVFDQHKDNVSKNLVTFRAEERIAFFTQNANSLVKVSLPVAP